MTQVKKTTKVPYTVAQMYELVLDVDRYPEFLPWCKAATINNRGQNRIQATIRGQKLGIDFVASFYYYLQPNKMITIQLLYTGPFQQIEGAWKFDWASNNESQFTFELNFEFSNRILGWTLTPIIKNESSNLLRDFVNRAKAIYG